ncbi:MAG: TIGR00269 family protein [Desulfurococcales archaeon ex4484_217_1]|nr:MAG: TIGR00269 family protein [Desulfurococcales archaeon ex4484_217_1]
MTIKCTMCGRRAVVKLRYARLSLCPEHFIEFIEKRFKKTIHKVKVLREVNKVVVAVSGGKDSVALLHLMHKVSKELGFKIIGLTIDLGIGEYSIESVNKAVKNYKTLGVSYKIVNLKKEYGFSINDVAKYRKRIGIKKPICSVCGTIKRYIMNKFALDVGANAVVTGHNLDDIVYYIFSTLYTGRIEDLARISIYTPSKYKLVAKVKPLAYISEKETLLYVMLRRLPFNYDVCPYARLRTFHEQIRRTSNMLEEKIPGLKITYARMFLEKINPVIYPYYVREEELKECKICKMPTTSEICAFCKIKLAMEKVLRDD